MFQSTLSLPTDYRAPTKANSIGQSSSLSRFEQLILSESKLLPVFSPATHPNPHVATALACPDLLLLKVENAESFQRFLREFVQHLVSQHERILLLAVDPGLANQTAHSFRNLGSVVRTSSTTDTLPDELVEISSYTLGPVKIERLRTNLLQTIQETTSSLDRWKSIFPNFSQLQRLSREWDEAQTELTHLRHERAGVRSSALTQAETPDTELHQRLAAIPSHAESPKIRSIQRQLDETQQSLLQLQRLRDDKKFGRLGFFRNLIVGDVESQVKDLEDSYARMTSDLDQAISEAQSQEQASREELISQAVSERDEELRQKIENIVVREQELVRQFQELASMIEKTGLIAPQKMTSEAVTDALCAAESTIQLAEEKHLSACESLQSIEADTDQAVGRMLGRMRVVVATIDSLSDPAVVAAPFDRVVALDAERMPDSTLIDATRQADRWVFCTGSPASANNLLAHTWSTHHRPNWLREQGRLICRLEHDIPSDLQTERLADRPEIGIQFGTREDGTPVLVSVDFPGDFPVADAVAFLARELDEIQPMTLGAGHWHDAPGARMIRWSEQESLTGDWIDVAEGVRQCIATVNDLPRTLAFRFDTSTGWTSETAKAWLESRLHTPRCLVVD